MRKIIVLCCVLAAVAIALKIRLDTPRSPERGAAAPTGLLHAEDGTAADPALNNLKAQIWEAELVQRNFATGLPHCSELNGTNFYLQSRDRVLKLEDYRRALDNFVMQGTFNPETKHSWNKQEADARWAQVQKQAATDQANCAAVASLPSLRKKLKDLQQQQSTPAGATSK